MRRRLLLTACVVGVASLIGLVPYVRDGPAHVHAASLVGIHKIRHVVILMQENRSFDSYFGTYPGADGIPRSDGRFTVCSPDPKTGRCFRPYHDTLDRNTGGPHQHLDAARDIPGGETGGLL